MLLRSTIGNFWNSQLILVIIIGGVVLLYIVYIAIQLKNNYKNEVKKVYVKLESINRVYVTKGMKKEDEGIKSKSESCYEVEFVSNRVKDTLKFFVTENECKNLIIGSFGELFYCGEKFWFFIPENAMQKFRRQIKERFIK